MKYIKVAENASTTIEHGQKLLDLWIKLKRELWYKFLKQIIIVIAVALIFLIISIVFVSLKSKIDWFLWLFVSFFVLTSLTLIIGFIICYYLASKQLPKYQEALVSTIDSLKYSENKTIYFNTSLFVLNMMFKRRRLISDINFSLTHNEISKRLLNEITLVQSIIEQKQQNCYNNI